MKKNLVTFINFFRLTLLTISLPLLAIASTAYCQAVTQQAPAAASASSSFQADGVLKCDDNKKIREASEETRYQRALQFIASQRLRNDERVRRLRASAATKPAQRQPVAAEQANALERQLNESIELATQREEARHQENSSQIAADYGICVSRVPPSQQNSAAPAGSPGVPIPVSDVSHSPSVTSANSPQAPQAQSVEAGPADSPLDRFTARHNSGAATAVVEPAAVPQKKPGVVRVGIFLPSLELDQPSQDENPEQIIRNELTRQLSGAAIEVIQMDSLNRVNAEAEARTKGIDFILYAALSIKSKTNQFGFLKKAADAISKANIPSGLNLGSMVTSNKQTVTESVTLLASLTSQVKAKDQVKLSYKIFTTTNQQSVSGETPAMTATHDRDDVVTRAIKTAAEMIAVGLVKQ